MRHAVAMIVRMRVMSWLLVTRHCPCTPPLECVFSVFFVISDGIAFDANAIVFSDGIAFDAT